MWDLNPKVLKVLGVLVLSLLITTPSLTAASLSREGNYLALGYSRAYVSPILLNDEFWRYGAYVEEPALLSFTPTDQLEFQAGFNGDFGYVVVVLDRSVPPIVLRGKVLGVVASLPTHIYNIVFALISREQLPKIASTPGVLAVLPDIRLDALINKEQKELREILSSDPVLAETLQTIDSDNGGYHYTVEITGAYDVWTQYGIRGENAKLAIIDTGVDFGSPGLGLDSIARDENGYPLIFDASSLGLVLTPINATYVGDGYIKIDPSLLYVFRPPYYVFRWNASLYVSISGCRRATLWIPFPEDNKWYVGNITFHGTVKFGLLLQYMPITVAGTSTTLWYTVPVIVVDSDGDGLYDTLYADTTTALYLVRQALAPSPCSVIIPGTTGATPDYSFADEEPIRYGNEVIARDLDGDGIRDFSIGALAGYVYDAAFAIILEKTGEWKRLIPNTKPLYGYSTAEVIMNEVWRYEPVALVWPGLDPHGDYVVIEYDYNSHGTYCANTAAGRDFYVETGYGTRSISGQAPATKIAASPALYFGTVAVSIYFFSGFDLSTPYGEGSRYLWPNLLVNPWIAFEGYEWKWIYMGEHQVDITSNSYGSSGWALWGWNTGSDPTSIIFDYTILTSGTMHFVAAGNGGPGYGTVASPAGSSFAISVGAATEFTYRPFYGYYWPGSSREVITWSSRGPTEIGVVKPDLVAVGAFAWAIGRTWDSLNNLYGIRNLTGVLAYNLFSGTSQATPMTAGVGSLVVSAYRAKYGSRIPPYLLKTVLMNYARDLGFDELSQGAGFVNAYGAVTAILDPSYPKVYSSGFARDVFGELGLNYATITYGGFMGYYGAWYEPKVFIPLVKYSENRSIVIEGSGTYKVYASRLESVGIVPLCDIVLKALDPSIIGCNGDTVLLNITASTVYGHLMVNTSALQGYDFFEVEAIYPYEFFESGGRAGNYTLRISSSILEFAYWIDVKADGVFSWYETARISYDIRRANALRLQIGRLGDRLKEIEELAEKYMNIDVSDLPKHLVVRLGVSGATYRGILPVKIRIVGYKLSTWPQVKVSPPYLTLANGEGTVTITVTRTLQRGFFSGYVVVEEVDRGLKYLVPVSFFVPVEISKEWVYKISPYQENTMRKNTYLRGAFDYTWRYESGDWRVFKVVLSPELSNIWALGIRVTWPTYNNTNYASNIDVHVYGPYTYYMIDEHGNVYQYGVNTVQLAAELTRDPAGGSGYNPTRFWDGYMPGESFLVAPATTPGVYRVVVRNIQFRGIEYSEPFTLEIIPITLRATYSYNEDSKTYEYTLLVKAAGYFTQLPPLTLVPSMNAIHLVQNRAEYVSNTLEIGMEVYAEVVLRQLSTGTLIARAHVKYTDTTPTGTYIIPISAVFSIPVTTVGWLEGGKQSIYFYHNEIPLVLLASIG